MLNVFLALQSGTLACSKLSWHQRFLAVLFRVQEVNVAVLSALYQPSFFTKKEKHVSFSSVVIFLRL